MHKKQWILSAAVLLIAGCADNTSKPHAEHIKAAEEASAKFYTSLNALFKGDAAPMKEVWSHADDVSYMGPGGGFQVGWDQVSTTWDEQAALKLGGKIEPQDTRVTVGNDLAFVQCYEKGDNKDAAGQDVKVSIRATNVFRKENGQWKMIAHHTDLLPFLENQSLSATK